MSRRFILCLLFAAVQVLAADVSGSWQFSVETSQGSGSPTFVFKQDGEKLTGRYSGALGEADVTGTVKGEKIEFSFNTEQVGKVVYSGVVESAAKMKGTAKFGELGDGTWTASKK